MFVPHPMLRIHETEPRNSSGWLVLRWDHARIKAHSRGGRVIHRPLVLKGYPMTDFRGAGGDQLQAPSEILAQPIPHAVHGVADASAELRERGLEVAIDNVEIRDIQSVTQQAGADCVCRARFTVIEA